MKAGRCAHLVGALALAAAIATGAASRDAAAAVAADIDRDSAHALQGLYKSSAAAELVGRRARAVLVFPKVGRSGLAFGGSFGEGVLIRNAHPVAYYNSVAFAWSWAPETESCAYVLFLMNDKALARLDEFMGREIGAGMGGVVVVDDSIARNMSAALLKDDAYAFVFDQRGLMMNPGVEGIRITRIRR